MVTPQFEYHKGQYALCRRCKARPCLCSELTAPAPKLRAVQTPPAPPPTQHTSGNAIPYAIWDSIIPTYTLSLGDGAVLAYLCRKTIGYGKPEGLVFSCRRIADALNSHRNTIHDALQRLQAAKLIIITLPAGAGNPARVRTHIRVTLPEG